MGFAGKDEKRRVWKGELNFTGIFEGKRPPYSPI